MRVLFGVGSRERLGSELETLGAQRALIIADPSKAGLSSDLADLIGPRCVGVYDQVAPHVPIETAEAGRAEVKRTNADCCITVGGGSSTGLGKAIAMEIDVPIIVTIIGEGGSGGAIALASSNKVLMFENAIYSVISPEGCATILWRDPKKTLEASKAMKLSSKDLYDLKIIDEIITEPVGGAHRDKDLILENVRNSIKNNLNFFVNMDKEEILLQRKNKFLSIGRSRGFSNNNNLTDNLSMKKTFVDKFIKYKNFFLILAIILIILILLNFL